jgi:cyclopropane fatty-acyl-phospholipid synthase-like methyltransferase
MSNKYLQPKKYFHFLVKKIKSMVSNLENGGERVDIVFSSSALLDENEKCHLKRYQFASTYITPADTVADFACGTGYGSALLAEKAARVVGVDIDQKVIASISEKYKDTSNLSFINTDLLQIDFKDHFDCIVSFETIEHFTESDIVKLLTLFHTALKSGGTLIMSTPYMQKNDKQALRAGFHKTFFIDETKITAWLTKLGFDQLDFYYQSYAWPAVSKADVEKDFVICVARKV